jgi:hypothetical protein
MAGWPPRLRRDELHRAPVRVPGPSGTRTFGRLAFPKLLVSKSKSKSKSKNARARGPSGFAPLNGVLDELSCVFQIEFLFDVGPVRLDCFDAQV